MAPSDKITLFELNQKVKEVLNQSFQASYWVIAEVSEAKENSSGHCYLELIQKDDTQDFPKAKARATIWAYTYRMLKPYFETTTGRSISAGIKVLISVQVIFHEVYGYSLNITDIEPSFTIGDIEQKRREAIEKLVADGVFDMNKGHELPILPKRVAVISSPSAAGLQDFVNQIHSNNYGYKIEHTLFAAVMQGGAAEESIISALNAIYDQYQRFDILVIIRGGGSQSDLGCFDSYWLASHVAQFPLPVITGIGHEKDISVVDLVAHTKLKTPTAVAEFIINRYIEAESILNDLKEKLEVIVDENISIQRQLFEGKLALIAPTIFQEISKNELFIQRLQGKLTSASNLILSREMSNTVSLLKSFELHALIQLKDSNNSLNQTGKLLSNCTLRFIEHQKNFIENSCITNKNFDPAIILKRGYSITLFNGKAIKDSKDVKKGERLTTLLSSGEIESTVV